MRERARAVRTKLSQAGLGVESGSVMTCTTSPLDSSVRSGASRLLIRQPTARSPTSLWMA